MIENQEEVADAIEAKIPPSGPSAIEKMVVAIGLSAHSEATVRYAAKWAERFGASINLVHVCPLESGDGFGISQEVMTALRSCPKCQMTVLEGDPIEKVTSLARSNKADLIVIGSHHQAGFLGRLFAPDNKRSIIHRAPCSVLVYQENCYKGEVASGDDSWRKPLPAQIVYLPH